jgi:preprotein translocase subunit SecB
MANKKKSKSPAVLKKTDKQVHIEYKDRLEAYNAAVDAARLESVQLIDLSFNVKPEFFETISKNRKFSYRIKSNNVVCEDDDDIAIAFIDFEVFAKKSRTNQLACKASYAVMYSGFTDCKNAQVKAFVRKVASFTCYPYFRSLIANLDWAAGTGLPPLPIHKEFPKSKEPAMENEL